MTDQRSQQIMNFEIFKCFYSLHNPQHTLVIKISFRRLLLCLLHKKLNHNQMSSSIIIHLKIIESIFEIYGVKMPLLTIIHHFKTIVDIFRCFTLHNICTCEFCG